jgi:putative lipoprotein
MKKLNLTLLCIALFTLYGCENTLQKKTSENFDKIMRERKRFKNMPKEDLTVQEQFKREIHSQSEPQREKKEFKFKN